MDLLGNNHQSNSYLEILLSLFKGKIKRGLLFWNPVPCIINTYQRLGRRNEPIIIMLFSQAEEFACPKGMCIINRLFTVDLSYMMSHITAVNISQHKPLPTMHDYYLLLLRR